MASRKTQEKLAKGRKAKVEEHVEDDGHTHNVEEATPAEVGFGEDFEAVLARAREQQEKMAAEHEESKNLLRRQVKALEDVAYDLHRIADALEARVGAGAPARAPEVITYEEALRQTTNPNTPAGDVKQAKPKGKPAPAKVDLKEAQRVFLAVLAEDREHAVRILKSYGVGRVSELPEEKYAEFVSSLQAGG